MKAINPLYFFFGLLAWVLWCNPASAQISEGGLPPSFLFKSIPRTNVEHITMPTVIDVAQLLAEDVANENKNIPLRVATIIPSDLNMHNAGEWSTLPGGTLIWTLTIKASGAIALMLYYDYFYLPEGSRLFIYNADKTQVLGAYTSKTNPAGAVFATEFVAGDEITLEYVAPPDTTKDKPSIQLSGVAYGYNNMSIVRSEGGQPAGPCYVNINCSEGDNWQNQKKGVCKTVTPIGLFSYLCSGTLVNNTAQDKAAYYLTAHHCFYGENNVYANLALMMFYFNYEAENCTGTSGASTTMTGAEMLVDLDINGASDGALIKLLQAIPESYDVYWNGWDRTDIAASSAASIHHPSGNIKKISTITTPPTSATWEDLEDIGAANAHWEVYYTPTENGDGMTAGGSSGAPLFNQNGLVVGTLSGGFASCSFPLESDLYGKFWYHWDKAGTASNKQMKTYLDPLNTGQETFGGRSYTQAFQNITFNEMEVKYTTSPSFVPDASASSGLPLYFTSNNLNVAQVINNKILINGVGDAEITAYQDGNEEYYEADSVSRILHVVAPPVPPVYPTLHVSEGFSPNNDGINDYFIIEGIAPFPNNSLVVFDVNGYIHYKMQGYDNNWDGMANQGRHKGTRLPVGTYYYILTVNDKVEKRSFIVIKY